MQDKGCTTPRCNSFPCIDLSAKQADFREYKWCTHILEFLEIPEWRKWLDWTELN